MKKNHSLTFPIFILAFYALIIGVVCLAMRLYELVNFPVGICFEVIGWCILFAVLTITSWAKSNKSAYQISLIFTTLIYTVVLDAVNLLLIDKTDNGGFVLLHLILLFVYCLVSIPMVIEGKR